MGSPYPFGVVVRGSVLGAEMAAVVKLQKVLHPEGCVVQMVGGHGAVWKDYMELGSGRLVPVVLVVGGVCEVKCQIVNVVDEPVVWAGFVEARVVDPVESVDVVAGVFDEVI